MAEINREEASWEDEPVAYGSCPILVPFIFTGMILGRLVFEGFVGELALLGDYRVRCIDIIFPKKEEPDQKKEVP